MNSSKCKGDRVSPNHTGNHKSSKQANKPKKNEYERSESSMSRRFVEEEPSGKQYNSSEVEILKKQVTALIDIVHTHEGKNYC